jgi:hypothetical protein
VANHPVLSIQEARSECPASLNAAKAGEQTYRQRLANLNVQPTPPETILPKSERIEQRQKDYDKRNQETHAARLKDFPIAGYYSFLTGKEVGTRNRRFKQTAGGHCVIEATGPDTFKLECEDKKRRHFNGTAKRTEKGLVSTFSDGKTVIFHVQGDGKHLSGMLDGHTIGLRRIGSFSPAQFQKVIAALPFTGRYNLTVSRGSQSLDLKCDVVRDTAYIPQQFKATCYRDDGTTHVSQVVPNIDHPVSLSFQSWTPALPRIDGAGLISIEFALDTTSANAIPPTWNGTARNGFTASITRGDPAAPLSFGTPLERLPGMNQSLAQTARHKGVLTLEQLANLDDAAANRLGIGWLMRRDQAREYLGQESKSVKNSPGPSRAAPRKVDAGKRDRRPTTTDDRRERLLKRLEEQAAAGNERAQRQLERMLRGER